MADRRQCGQGNGFPSSWPFSQSGLVEVHLPPANCACQVEVLTSCSHRSAAPLRDGSTDSWRLLLQWAGSCWYYLRYIDPGNAGALVDPEAEKYWMPVDLYVGGAEHAVLHLLYARFWHKARRPPPRPVPLPGLHPMPANGPVLRACRLKLFI